jgi:DNA-binding Lrp family transcriptional regulator
VFSFAWARAFLREDLGLVTAYVLAKVEAGKDEVLEKVKKLPGIRSAVSTVGIYDLHVEVAFVTKESLDEFIFDKIRRIPRARITETVTLISFEAR